MPQFIFYLRGSADTGRPQSLPTQPPGSRGLGPSSLPSGWESPPLQRLGLEGPPRDRDGVSGDLQTVHTRQGQHPPEFSGDTLISLCSALLEGGDLVLTVSSPPSATQ